MLTTDQGAVYYVDHINKRTCWDPPQMSSGGQSVLDTGRPDIREHQPDILEAFFIYDGESFTRLFFFTLLFTGVLVLGAEYAILER